MQEAFETPIKEARKSHPIMKRPLKPRYRFDQNAHHFQLLGLKRGECRIEVIRQAARRRATDIAGRSHPATVDLHRAEIAVATYRLLDPRGRTQLYERVQLSCPIDHIENVGATLPPQSSLNRKLNLAPAPSPAIESVANTARNVRMMDGRVVEQAMEQPGECPKDNTSEEEESRKTTASYMQVCRNRRSASSNNSAPEMSAANAAKIGLKPTCRESAEWSTVDWIRACLGI